MGGRSLPLFLSLAALLLCAVPAAGATIEVDVTNDELNDDGDCTIREAIESANENQAISGCAKGQQRRDTILLQETQYTIGAAQDEDQNQAGDFDVSANGPVTIRGKGREDTVIFQSGGDRVFDVLFSANLTLQRMRVSGGDVTSFASPDARGGNIRANGGKVILDQTRVASGDALAGGGLYVASANGRAKVSRSLFESNDATGNGGSMSLQGGGKGRIERTTFQLSEVASSTANAEGGIIFSTGSGLKIFDSVLQGSSAETTGAGNFPRGAALYSNAPLTMKRSTVRGNTTSAATDGVAEQGGGLFISGGTALIVNSTFFDNRAGEPGGDDGIGGAIYAGTSQVDVKHVTFDSNQGSDEGDTLRASGGNLRLFGSIIDDAPDPCAGTSVASTGFNVSESIDTNCSFIGSDVPGGDPGLGSLADNGGFTDTIAIVSTSDAKNRVPPAKCKDATGNEDQRGFKRPKGPKCDAGSFERGATSG